MFIARFSWLVLSLSRRLYRVLHLSAPLDGIRSGINEVADLVRDVLEIDARFGGCPDDVTGFVIGTVSAGVSHRV